MRLSKHLASTAVAIGLAASAAAAHPLDGLSPEEYQKINEILRAEKIVDDNTLYPQHHQGHGREQRKDFRPADGALHRVHERD